MPTWIREPSHQRIEEYGLFFAFVEHPSAGFCFPCDSLGNVKVEELQPPAREAYAECVAGAVDGKPVEPGYLQDFSRGYWDPGSLRCGCGREHQLARGDSVCVCGQWFNAGGQALVDPSQWEENLEED